MDIGDENGYGKDMGILWAAYKAGSFRNEGWDQEEFARNMIMFLSQFDSLWIAEDRNDSYPNQRGAVGMFMVRSDGFLIQPDVDFFAWATKRNKLRTIVAFLNWVRFSKDVGLCVFGSMPETKNLFWRMREYGIMVTYVGNGMFCLAGEKPCQH